MYYNDCLNIQVLYMLMTMGVFNKHDYKHELLTLRQRQFYGIIESMAEM